MQSTKSLLEEDGGPRLEVYWQRWWLVVVFSALGALQSAQWNFYSPISTSVTAIYGWTNGTVSWMANTAGIVFTLTVTLWSGIMDTRGPRLVTLISCTCVLIAACLRCVPCENSQHVYFVFASMVFNGLSAPPIGLAPPMISAAWFPANERGTATALMTTANYLGQAVGFVSTSLSVPSLPSNHTAAEVDDRQSDLKELYLVEAIVALIILICAVAYFPDKPPLPPSVSASEKEAPVSVCHGIGELIYHGNFWILVLAFGVPSGMYSGWVAFLGPNLKALGIDQGNAAIMGCLAILAGVLAGIGVGQLSDRFGGQIKRLILGMYALAAVSFLWFALMCSRILPFSLPLLYVATIVAGLAINGTIPLFYELGVETTHPIAEGATTGFLVLIQNLIQSCFLAVPVDNVGTAWMNWTVAAVIPAGFVGFLMFKEEYKRSAVDLAAPVDAAYGLIP